MTALDCAITFSEAVVGENVIRFEYSKPTAPHPQKRTFSPWEVDEDAGTVLGYDHDRQEIRRFTMANAWNLQPYSGDTYVRPST